MATRVGVRSMGKGSEPHDSLSTQKTDAGARRHRRRSSESVSELGSHAFRSEQRQRHQAEAIHDNNHEKNLNMWDCESSLYDSFELFAFLRQLNGMLPDASNPSPPARFRSLSMPHYVGFRRSPAEDDRLPEVKAGRPDSQNAAEPVDQKRRAKFPWSVGKLMKGLLKRSGSGSKL